ncbi:type II toxin-antitoxin system VapC family toxin [Pseudorhodoplanes sp.]|uniref:type II toxin-antitoxin system VapC family toxin n=1 Tax=Pseudorhodoplanes sp. TaxID=1934341 RepID=UPI00391B5C04
MIVVDASVVVAWLLGEKSGSSADHVFDALPDGEAIAPAHWPLEIGNALYGPAKAGQLSPDDFETIMEDLDWLNIQIEPAIHPDEIGPLVQFAVAHGLTTYDAAYVQLALLNDAVLVTLDRAMKAAAQKLGIAVLPA